MFKALCTSIFVEICNWQIALSPYVQRRIQHGIQRRILLRAQVHSLTHSLVGAPAWAKRRIVNCVLTGLFVSLSFGAEALADTPLLVAWNVRPPYQYLENGVEKGERLERVKQIFSLTKIPFNLVQEPPKRIWNQYAAGVKNYCSFDWYRLPEREALVQFTIPLEKNAAYSVLTNTQSYVKVAAHPNLKSLLSDANLTFGMVDSASYGPELEAMIKDSKNKQERHSVLPMIMARMIGANRASFMLIEKAGWDFLKDSDSYFRQTRIVEMAGIPKGLDSYIVCSKDISAEKITKINDAIRQLTKPAPLSK